MSDEQREAWVRRLYDEVATWPLVDVTAPWWSDGADRAPLTVARTFRLDAPLSVRDGHEPDTDAARRAP